MNRYTIFLNLENQYCDKDYNTQNNQQIQCNSYQTTNAFLAELEQIISQFLWKCKDPKSPMQSWEGKMDWRNQASWFQTILQSYSHQDSMLLTRKQKYRPLEQDRKPRNKPIHPWVPHFWQRRQEYTMGQRQPLQ